MKTAIVYYSQHHGNTKKLLDAIAKSSDVALYDVREAKELDFSEYERIGLASGIYYGKFAKQVLDFAMERLPEGKDVFYIATCGASPAKAFVKEVKRIAEAKGCRSIGEYLCNGYDTFGPFKLVGGIAKGHPTAEEIAGAVAFYQRL